MPRTLNVTGATLIYDEFGESPDTIVFVHGAGGNHLSWWNQIPQFSDRFRCVTYEVRGWGQSQDLSGEGRTAFARDLGELMDQLEITEAALVGQSMGGFSILPYAARNPDRVTALLMADTMLGIADQGLLDDMRVATAAAAENARLGGMTRMVGPAYLERSPNGVFLYNQIRALNPPLDLDRPLSFGVEDGAIAVEELAALTMPVVFLAGEEDAIIPAAVIKRAAGMVPGARFVEVPTGGHSVYWELPTEFNAILEELLAEAYS